MNTEILFEVLNNGKVIYETDTSEIIEYQTFWYRYSCKKGMITFQEVTSYWNIEKQEYVYSTNY